MELQETGNNSVKAESEVVYGNQFRKSGQNEMAINKYKCAIYLFIYSIEDAQKESKKAYYQLRINQILNLLNETEAESHQKLSTLNELKQYALNPSNRSQILSYTGSLDIRCSINYPPLNVSNISLSQYGSFHSDPNSQYPDFSEDMPTVKPLIVDSCGIMQSSYGSTPLIDITQYPTITFPQQPNHNCISQQQIPNYNNSSQIQNQTNNMIPSQNPTNYHQSKLSKTSIQSNPHGISSNHSKSTPLISDRIINLNNFEIIESLGFGSFGNVYLAQEKSTLDKFAIKELTRFESSEDQKSFLREVEALTQAVHPAVLHLRGFCLNPIPSIVTEYLPGGSLQDVINGTKPMNKTQRVKALFGVASAMRYLHEKLSIVHRDLKPANVMLNQNLEPVVGDFGLAKMMTKMMMRQTQKAGSPVYMAPELISGKEYTNKVDVYSFGILCFELLSESLAFSEVSNLQELMNKVLKGDRPNLYNTKISNSFRDLISRCWNEDAEQRPSFRIIVRELKNDQYLEDIDQNDYMEYVARLRKADAF